MNSEVKRAQISRGDASRRNRRNPRATEVGRRRRSQAMDSNVHSTSQDVENLRRVPISPSRTCSSYAPYPGSNIHRERKYKCCFILWQRWQKSMTRCFGIFLILFAILQLVSGMLFAAIHVVLTFSPEEVTSDLQSPLPIYLSAVIVALSGLCQMVLSKLRSTFMILTGIFFSISSCVVTLAGLLSTSTVALPKFTSFIQFIYYPTLELCVAFTRWDRKPNGSFTGGVMFEGLSGCSIIESTLPPLTLALVVFYAISCITSFISCFILSIMLCLPENSDKKKHDRGKRPHQKHTSSYINYGLELDDICEAIVAREKRCAASQVEADKPNAPYLPGVNMPYYTLPYRIPFGHCNSSTVAVDNNIGRQVVSHINSAEHLSRTQSCNCNCRVVSSLGNSGDTVVSASIQPSTISATVRPHRSAERPVLPPGFRTDSRPACASRRGDQSGHQRRSQDQDTRRIESNNRRCRLREEGRQPQQIETALSASPRRQGAFEAVRGIHDTPRRANLQEDIEIEVSSPTRRQQSFLPPPYSELPAYDQLVDDDNNVTDPEAGAERHATQESCCSRSSVETLL